jgi:NADH-ubiquinone oxidoreductase chain 4
MTGGLLAIVFTSFTSTRQLDLKKLLAYVSIVHMNLLIIGLLSSNLTAIAGSIIMFICHGFVSSGLFLFVGQLYDRFYTRNIKYLRGLSGAMPLFGIILLCLTFANIAVPGSFNFIGEILILIGATSNT